MGDDGLMTKRRRATAEELQQAAALDAHSDLWERVADGSEPRRAGHRGTIRGHGAEPAPAVVPEQAGADVDQADPVN